MAVCAVTGSAGLELQQLSSAADSCAGVVLLQPADAPPSIFTMDAATGALVSGAVATVWLAAWGWRAVYSVLNGSSTDE